VNPYAILGALILVGSILTGAYFKGRSDMDAVWQEKMIVAERAAHAREIKLQEAANEIGRQYQIDRSRISTDLADALERLRERPERMPEPARAACSGGTGAELSSQDAGFLEREAARADELRAALQACKAWVDNVITVTRKQQ
jgi:hypothetical protein